MTPILAITIALIAPKSGASVDTRCEIAWLRFSPSKQVGSLPVRYAHILELAPFAKYRSITVVEERVLVYVDTEAKLLEFPSFPKEHSEKVHTKFLGPNLFRAELVYGKHRVLVAAAPPLVPTPFVTATSDGKCMVAASDSDCWVLTIRTAPAP